MNKSLVSLKKRIYCVLRSETNRVNIRLFLHVNAAIFSTTGSCVDLMDVIMGEIPNMPLSNPGCVLKVVTLFQAQLQEVKDCGCRVAAAKEAYKEAFARLDLVATEIEQRKSITDLRNGNGDGGKDLSKFEEIDDIGNV